MTNDNQTVEPADPQPEPQVEPTEPSAEPQAAADPADGAQAKNVEPPTWEYRKNFKVVDKMKHIVNLSIDVSKAEIEQLRKRIEKLTYGS